MTETDIMPLTDLSAALAKESNLTRPVGTSGRYNTVLETVRQVMNSNPLSQVYYAITAMESQDSAVRLCQDIYEDACNEAQSAFDAAVSNLDEPWCSLIENSGCVDPTEWVDDDTFNAVCELDILESWEKSLAQVLFQHLYYYDGSVAAALVACHGNLNG